MACFIPIATALRASFLRPVKLRTPLPARSSDEVDAIQMDLKIFHHVAKATCTYNEWLAFRALVQAEVASSEYKHEANILPIDREMNKNRVLFGSIPFALLFCGLELHHISHLQGPITIQNKICYIVPGAICRTTTAVSTIGVILNRSRPGSRRMIDWVLPREDDAANDGIASIATDSGNGACGGVKSVKSIDLTDEGLAIEECPASLFRIIETNIHDPVTDWDACSAYRAQTDKFQNVIIRFSFPIVASGDTFDLQKLAQLNS